MEQSKISTGDRLLGMAYFVFCAIGLFACAGVLYESKLKEGLFMNGYLIFNGSCDLIGIFFGIGLFYRKKWTDAFLRYIGWLFLLKIPLGTVLGVITIVYEIRRPLQYGGKVSEGRAQEMAPEAGRENTLPAGEARGSSETLHATIDKQEVNRKTARLLLRLLSVLVPIPLALIIGMIFIHDWMSSNGPPGAYAGFWLLILFTLAGAIITVAGFVASFLLFKEKKKQNNHSESSK